MKKLAVLIAVFSLLSIGAMAQAKIADYSGEWSMDKSKSTLPDRMRNVEGMTMSVTQTEKDLKVVTSVKRGAPPQGGPGSGGPGGPPAGGPPNGAPPPSGDRPPGPPPGGGPGGPGGLGGGGRGMGGGILGSDQSLSYTLDGKETTSEYQGGVGPATLKNLAKTDGGNLNLTSVRIINTQMGEMKVTTKEVWELQADGSLKVKRDTETQQGTMSAEFVFTKKTK